MSVNLAKADTALIKKVLDYGTDKYGKVFSEKRAYGRRVNFWLARNPGDVTEVNFKLRKAFGDRFISACYYGGNFEVQLKPFDTVTE